MCVRAFRHWYPSRGQVRAKTVELLNGYVQIAKITERTDTYIVPSRFKSMAGAVGALELARSAYSSAK